jgi:hypothetical protein
VTQLDPVDEFNAFPRNSHAHAAFWVPTRNFFIILIAAGI